MYINLRNIRNKTYNYLSLAVGIFLNFYKNKRPMRRSKLFKVLLVKFFRKILLASTINRFHMVVNRMTTNFSELFKVLMTPDINPYEIPGRQSFYRDDEENSKSINFFFYKFLFLRSHYFGVLKGRSRGRVKRKIKRRLIRRNKVLD